MTVTFLKEYTNLPVWIDRDTLNQMGFMGVRIHQEPVEPVASIKRRNAVDAARWDAYNSSTTDGEAASKCGISLSRFNQWRNANNLPKCSKRPHK